MFVSNSEMLLIFLLFNRAYNTAKKRRKMTLFLPLSFSKKGLFAQIFCTTVSEYIFDEDSEHNNSLRFNSPKAHSVFCIKLILVIHFECHEGILQPVKSERCVRIFTLEKSSICILLNYLPSCLI